MSEGGELHLQARGIVAFGWLCFCGKLIGEETIHAFPGDLEVDMRLDLLAVPQTWDVSKDDSKNESWGDE